MNFISAELKEQGKRQVFCICGQEIPVTEKRVSMLKPHCGKQVKIGVRSHQIRIAKDKTPQTLQATVRLVENLGRKLGVDMYESDSPCYDV